MNIVRRHRSALLLLRGRHSGEIESQRSSTCPNDQVVEVERFDHAGEISQQPCLISLPQSQVNLARRVTVLCAVLGDFTSNVHKACTCCAYARVEARTLGTRNLASRGYLVRIFTNVPV
jgi:hypothetical protein